eukprot:365570-Chlamydomonas_euryale.AAC.8
MRFQPERVVVGDRIISFLKSFIRDSSALSNAHRLACFLVPSPRSLRVMSRIPALADSMARTLHGDTIDLTKSNGDLRAHPRSTNVAAPWTPTKKISRILCLRKLRASFLDRLTPIVESLHDEIEDTVTSERRLRVKYDSLKRERDKLFDDNKRLKRLESNAMASCLVCLDSVGLNTCTIVLRCGHYVCKECGDRTTDSLGRPLASQHRIRASYGENLERKLVGERLRSCRGGKAPRVNTPKGFEQFALKNSPAIYSAA